MDYNRTHYPRILTGAIVLALAASLGACSPSPNSVAGCTERDPVSLSLDELPDPPHGTYWSLAQMRAGIEGVHHGELYPVENWSVEAEDVPPERFTPIVIEARLQPEAQLIEFDDNDGPNDACSVQDVRLFADVDVRVEDGELLGTAKMVELYISAGDNTTYGFFRIPASEALADVLWESLGSLPDEVQFNFVFSFIPDDDLGTQFTMNGWGLELDSTRPLARALVDEHVPFDE